MGSPLWVYVSSTGEANEGHEVDSVHASEDAARVANGLPPGDPKRTGGCWVHYDGREQLGDGEWRDTYSDTGCDELAIEKRMVRF